MRTGARQHDEGKNREALPSTTARCRERRKRERNARGPDAARRLSVGSDKKKLVRSKDAIPAGCKRMKASDKINDGASKAAAGATEAVQDDTQKQMQGGHGSNAPPGVNYCLINQNELRPGLAGRLVYDLPLTQKLDLPLIRLCHMA
ncbi:hypothetical protein EVAR_36625_1 [Eumeta japonica]|uniref:Uncharacterized protein n=1 Tax=Eumeta variegata TaxID=151549 RepID=A0A4C1ZUQ6_EUMVA|nr:hypothetical protein EVAR_36625_1 [Eumeta japonica]